MMLLRVRSLALGHSGVRPLVAQALVDLLNADITPWVPEHGSLGASGDLAPLAHCALVLLGEGWVLGKAGARIDGGEALRRAGLRPIALAAKEGLALINGTDGMLGMLLLAIDDAAHLFTMADVTAALAIEAMLGSERPFQPELHAIRPHPGQAVSAANIHRLLQGSAVMDSHRDDLAHAVQDAYSMRCAPQVAGAARDTLDVRHPGRRARAAVRCGQPGGAAGRAGRVDRQLPRRAARLRRRLPRHRGRRGGRDRRAPGRPAARRVPARATCRAFLTPDPGVNSGLMIAQYTAAGIVAENRRLAVAGVGRLAADQRHAGGPRLDGLGGRRSSCARVLDNLTSLLAVELLAAVRGLQLRAPLTPSPAGRAAIGRGDPVRRRARAGRLPRAGDGGGPRDRRGPRPAGGDRDRRRPARLTVAGPRGPTGRPAPRATGPVAGGGCQPGRTWRKPPTRHRARLAN